MEDKNYGANKFLLPLFPYVYPHLPHVLLPIFSTPLFRSFIKSNPGGMPVIRECKLIFSKERHCPRPIYIHQNILVVSFCWDFSVADDQIFHSVCSAEGDVGAGALWLVNQLACYCQSSGVRILKIFDKHYEIVDHLFHSWYYSSPPPPAVVYFF